MKIIIPLVVFLIALFLIGNKVFKSVSERHQGRQLAVAFGVPQRGEIQIHVAIPPMVPRRDPPETNAHLVPLWGKWVDDHFQLTDASGTMTAMLRMGTSSLILENKKSGIDPEFVLWAFVAKGKDYTLDIIPILTEQDRYRFSFTAPNEVTKVERRTFDLVSED